jgi:hypothetical protein
MPAGRKPKDCAGLILALACGASPESAAQKTGLSLRTVYRRLAEPAFRAEVDSLQAQILSRAVGMSGAATLGSIKTLTTLQDSAKSEAVRLGSARALVDIHCKLRQTVDQQARIDAIESRLRQLLEIHPGPANEGDAP